MELPSFDKNFGLAGKTALITGAGSGIGRAIADLFHEKGANVVLVDLDPVDAEGSLDAARSAAVAGDVTQAVVREQAVATSLERFGAIDILVNNAGLSRLAPALELTEEQWDVTMNLKVLALEWGPHNIQTNAISPTVVLTEMGRKYWVGERAEAMTKKIPNGRFAYPEEIAACALFLASDAATMINGQNILVGGGYTAH